MADEQSVDETGACTVGSGKTKRDGKRTTSTTGGSRGEGIARSGTNVGTRKRAKMSHGDGGEAKGEGKGVAVGAGEGWLKFNIKSKEGSPLSNFFRGEGVEVMGRRYSGGEEAFHGEKFRLAASMAATLPSSSQEVGAEAVMAHAERFRHVNDPRKAKLMGGKGKQGLRLPPPVLAAWDGESGSGIHVQRAICQWKLAHDRAVQEALESSGERPLLHQDNRAKASCPWGGRIDKTSGELIGRNRLGIIWTQVRAEWRAAGGWVGDGCRLGP